MLMVQALPRKYSLSLSIRQESSGDLGDVLPIVQERRDAVQRVTQQDKPIHSTRFTASDIVMQKSANAFLTADTMLN